MSNNRDVTAISNQNSERQRTRRVNGISSILRNQKTKRVRSSFKQTIPRSTAHRLILWRWYTWAIHYVIQYRGWSTRMCNRSFAMNRKWNRSRRIIIGFFLILSSDWTASVKYFIIDFNRSMLWMPCQQKNETTRKRFTYVHAMRVCRSRLQCLLREYDTTSRCWTWFFFIPSSATSLSCNTIHATIEAVSSSSSPIHRHDHRIRPAAFYTLNKWSASVVHDKRERYVVLSKCVCADDVR